ncbi:heme-binding protein [Microbulbifer sp. SSSA007]|uniref:heme-binding protein n=1 Tax=Microbulbifer sp. SSSA007 TaxID=3243379 RepID=UPI00403A2D7A
MIIKQDALKRILSRHRKIIKEPDPSNEDLGPLKEFPGIWENTGDFKNHGWNIIALPFLVLDKCGEIESTYRLLVNQYNEKLTFNALDGPVPNRGVIQQTKENLDQFLFALEYEQTITQVASEDFPNSGRAGDPGAVIHDEPGLWLHIFNHTTNNINIARLASIPHGNSVLALGSYEEFNCAPVIPFTDSLPVGHTRDVCKGYLAPYRHFSEFDIDKECICESKPAPDPNQGKFRGKLDVLDPAALLREGTPPNVVKTTKIEVTTRIEDAGIVNIPFIVKHANATEMTSTFWIMETDKKDDKGRPIYVMQYMQVIMLEFFPRLDGEPGLIRWPHISFNTMQRRPFD